MKKKLILILFALILVSYFGINSYLKSTDPLIKWDWNKINTEEKHFPKDFVWGVATAAHQVEGANQSSNFGWWEKQTNSDGSSKIVNGDNSDIACDHWNRYPEDIQLMKQLGVKSYRFSIAWNKIYPKKDVIDSMALKHYVDVCDSLISNGIEPMVTLHHFTHPLWFEELGAFEKEENIGHFLDFSKVVYLSLKDKVTKWCTFNEPSVFMFSAYLSGAFPPGKNDPQLGGTVLKNMLLAHVKVYHLIKSLPGGSNTQIGLVKNMTQMDAMNTWNILDNFIVYFSDKNFNEVVLECFKSGHFSFYMPGMADIETEIKDAPKTLDFIGLNYYSHQAFDFNGNIEESLEPLPYPGERMTDMEYGLYPEGIYRAIKRIAKLNVPIYITENGVADSLDNRRAEFIDKYLYAVSKAIEDGYDIRGYYYWSLMDNFEWNLGYGQQFGLCHVNFNTQERNLKEGSKKYIEIISRFKEK
ncbi:MAG: family 1 glycosylhydrolase [Bacteroidales bacterium]|nr:family 1 glycosylhydrolase [Bacteroidales bacterium]